MAVKKLREFLDANGVKYVLIRHSPAYTAQEIAASAHVSGRELAKTIVVKLDGELAVAVLPATASVDFGLLEEVSGAKTAELAGERDFRDRFPECELGAMPPFGNLYSLDVYVDKRLAEDETIAFNAGTHKELVKLAYKDFVRLVKPKVGRFS